MKAKEYCSECNKEITEKVPVIDESYKTYQKLKQIRGSLKVIEEYTGVSRKHLWVLFSKKKYKIVNRSTYLALKDIFWEDNVSIYYLQHTVAAMQRVLDYKKSIKIKEKLGV